MRERVPFWQRINNFSVLGNFKFFSQIFFKSSEKGMKIELGKIPRLLSSLERMSKTLGYVAE